MIYHKNILRSLHKVELTKIEIDYIPENCVNLIIKVFEYKDFYKKFLC